MSYLVLARKYRPQTFSDLVGQEQVSRTLQNALATGRVAHAYLFSGPRGVGKTTAARLLAMSLSCQAENVADRPCGQCHNCLEIQGGQAVDVIEVDGASNRGINEIRDLRETVKYLPAKSRYKVYIIDEVHALTKDAFNALLKTLEEPPPHVVFIFATTETHKVLPTILSRCQRYDFRRIRVEDIVGRLAKVAELENIQAEPEALELIARQAEGGLRDSLSLMDQAIAAGSGSLTAEEVRRSLGLIDQALVRSIVKETLAGNASGALAALDEAYLRGYDFKDLGVKILEYIRALTLVKVSRDNVSLMNVTETEEAGLTETSSAYSLETLNHHFDAWLKFQRELNYSPQPRWLLEAQVIRLSQLAPLMPMTELIDKMGRLLSQNPPPRPSGAVAAASSPPALSVSGGRAETTKKKKPDQPLPAPKMTAQEPEPGQAEIPTDGSRPNDNSDVPAEDWTDFVLKYFNDLDGYSQNLLKGAQASQWSPEIVIITLAPGDSLGSTMRRHLEGQLLPLLTKALGARPQLTLEQPEDHTKNDSFIAERLAEVKNTPEAQRLMAEIPGSFIVFRPGAVIPDMGEAEGEAEAVVEDSEENGDGG